MAPHPNPHVILETSLVADDFCWSHAVCHWENGLSDVPPWSLGLLVSLPSISVSGRAGARAANGECICSCVGTVAFHVAGCVLFLKIDL